MIVLIMFSCANIIVFLENVRILGMKKFLFQYSHAFTPYSMPPVWSLE